VLRSGLPPASVPEPMAARDGFECFDNWLSQWTSDNILAGRTYPQLPLDVDIRTVVDVGANCGAATVYFAQCYPDATIHALEPAAASFALLTRNTRPYANVRLHNVGLHSREGRAPLYAGAIDSVTASIYSRDGKNSEGSETVELRTPASWIADHGITSIDVLKVDTEGNELVVLEGFRELLADVKLVYVEYDSTPARRRIDRLLEPSHELCRGMMLLDQGEMIFVSRALLKRDARTKTAIMDRLRDLVVAEMNSGAQTTRSVPA
jgi:FkbM family methyltransferase